MSTNVPTVALGQQCWQQLQPAFLEIMQANGFTTEQQRAQVYGGFLAALSGAMAGDVTPYHAETLLLAVLESVRGIAEEERKAARRAILRVVRSDEPEGSAS